ncbi:hypothetical protein ACFOY4_25210 [Actinomadura syzygii]|uniref:Uncharacterized protein n=1 Tax=Actinomadura syzygii TaxID=1427538 RepID=A0A5D0UL08_9ACTN|nr:hypothetical protein [Actinomadura syzygii]TYC18293.1 hypothetical protein FXF65_00520 [Actinomadura syzygii]
MLTRGHAFRSVVELVPYPVRRIVGFDAKGLVSIVLLVARRRHGVPKGAFFDLRVPRGSILAVRVARNYDERGMVRIRDGKLSVAVAAQTNVIVELDAPISVVRPLGGRDTARTIRFYADDPAALATAFSEAASAPKIQERAGRRDAG